MLSNASIAICLYGRTIVEFRSDEMLVKAYDRRRSIDLRSNWIRRKQREQSLIPKMVLKEFVSQEVVLNENGEE